MVIKTTLTTTGYKSKLEPKLQLYKGDIVFIEFTLINSVISSINGVDVTAGSYTVVELAGKAKETITNFINLNNVSFNNAEFLNPILAEYDGVNFEAIKDLINQYIPLVSATLSIYLTDKEQHKKIVEEFRKSLLYISNISQNRNKKANSNIAISSYIESL